MTKISYTNVIAVNELMKLIVITSRQVNLAALNAMLLSRKGGERTIGFATVTKELRKFTRSLEAQMQRLSASLNFLIYDLSNFKKNEHRFKLMRLALLKTDIVQDLLSRQLLHQQLDIKSEQLSIGINGAIDRVFVEIERSALTCSFGQNLAVLAKIESQNGGEYKQALMNVSNTIETIITSIDTNLKQARGYIQHSLLEEK